jgi:myo-inositol-1(or 4)-monophosphatase
MSAESATPDALLRCAVEAVRRAGAHARANMHRRAEHVARAAHDVKLALDHECQREIERTIRAQFPAHAILGEEGGLQGDAGGWLWVVDPLDGTVNFSHGIPYWCHSVAVQRSGETLAAAVYAPVFDELFTATAEGPALCNGAPIRVSDTPTLAEALLLTGVEKNFDQYSDSIEVARAVAAAAQKIRLLGAAALDLCQVACGRADGFYESGLNVWDVAAADLICRRAGAVACTVARIGAHKVRYIATNGRIDAELMTLLGRYPSWLVGA